MIPFSHFFYIGSFICILWAGQAQGTFDSPIFSYEDARAAKNLIVKLSPKDARWQARNIVTDDIPFHQSLFANPAVMAGFAERRPRDFEATKTRIETIWLPRFEKGQPHGGLTVFNAENQKIGHALVGGDEAHGVAEIAYSLVEEQWRKGIIESIVRTLIEEWAPEVRRIGLGIGYNTSTYDKVQQAFNCFEGTVLKKFYATASPSNTGPCKILDKTGFKAEDSKVQNQDYVLTLDGRDDLTPNLIEAKLLALFSSAHEAAPLKSGGHYRIVDQHGKVRVFSKHDKLNCIKYHSTYKLLDA